MIKHIVMWRLKNGEHDRDGEAMALEVKHRIEAMRGAIPGLRHIEGGVDFGRSGASCDVVLYAELESREALAGYQVHPAHENFKAFIGPRQIERHLVDYEI